MRLRYPLLPLSFICSLTQAAVPESRSLNDIPNAPHIFNTIHSSMRQWGSSLNHNGMSFFLATVPTGIQLYHGTYKNEPILGMEWLAFEPEHAMIFARGRGPPPPRDPDDDKDPKGPPPPHPEEKEWNEKERQRPFICSRCALQDPDRQDHEPPKFEPGYLHTYATGHPLSLLYVDGMSAGKTPVGTLDSQDVILLDYNDTPAGRGFWDYERAKGMCERAATDWGNRIDGILRMEGGFEVILCNFENHLDVERITQAKTFDGGHLGFGEDKEILMSYYKALTARYDGIGADRVSIDYEHMVTAYAFDLDLWKNAYNHQPRLANQSVDALDQIRDAVDEMVRKHATPSFDMGKNWQSIADAVVGRYAARLNYLVSGKFETKKSLNGELERVLQPFIDFSDRNTTTEIERCSTQFLAPPGSDSSLAHHTIFNISATICATISHALHTSALEKAIFHLTYLINKLNWTEWKKCSPSCGYDEICFVPIWPYGTLEDWKEPHCVKEIPEISWRKSYWGNKIFGPPPKSSSTSSTSAARETRWSDLRV